MTTSRQKSQEPQPDSASQAEKPFSVHSHKPSQRAEKAATLYFSEHKSFRQSMLESGYSPSIAAQGPKYNLRRNVSLRMAFERASHNNLRPEQLKMLAVHRLASEIASPQRTDGVKPIEVLGKMKEYDWFVRNSETNVGILLALELPSNLASTDGFDEK